MILLTLRLNPTSCDIPGPKDEGVQLDEDDSQELSPAECIAEQHIVNAWRRTQEQQVRNELMAQEVEEEGASMSKQMSMQIDVNISDIQGPLRTIKAERRLVSRRHQKDPRTYGEDTPWATTALARGW